MGLSRKFVIFLNVLEWFWRVFHIVFECFLMSWRSRNLLGVILNEFWIDHFRIIFSHFCHFLSVECRLPEYLLQGRSGLRHLSLDM